VETNHCRVGQRRKGCSEWKSRGTSEEEIGDRQPVVDLSACC
jgi:hypothetical protein